MSYAFDGIGSQDRVMGDYPVQNLHISQQEAGHVDSRGGHLMLGGWKTTSSAERSWLE